MIQTAPKTDEERQALRAHNMDVFERHKIAMANRLKQHVPITKLVFDEDGQPDIEFQGEKFYDGDYYNNLETQIERFKHNPRRFGLQIPQPSQFDRIGERFLTEVLRRATFAELIHLY
ncbi:MAG: hypothetical protein F6K19_47725, partial [Cyanothece sp. SIO1E1]|nr:hypothetical protein [Cyanothece sp. SIO1E1]